MRLALSSLNKWKGARIHCDSSELKLWHPNWLHEVHEHEQAVARWKQRTVVSSNAALRGVHCRPAISKDEVLHTMRNSKFCLCPRGDSPSSGRVYYAISLGCIPIIVSDPWMAMADPFAGLLKVESFALMLPEHDAIISPEHATRTVLLRAGAQPTATMDGNRTARIRSMHVNVPMTNSPNAAPLKARLAAMRRVHRAALWQLKDNQLIANLTLASVTQLLSNKCQHGNGDCRAATDPAGVGRRAKGKGVSHTDG